jgi:hypothetical protein
MRIHHTATDGQQAVTKEKKIVVNKDIKTEYYKETNAKN